MAASSSDAQPAQEVPLVLPERLKRAETILRLRTDRIALVLEHSSDYQNIAACIRTAESFGITTVYMVKSATMRVYRSNQRDEGDIAAVIHAAGTAADDLSGPSRVQAVGSASAPSASSASSALPSGAAAARSAHSWVNIRPFTSISECIRALREDGREIWATDLSPGAELLTTPREAASFARLGIYQPETRSDVASSSASASESARSAGIDELPKRLAIVMGRETDGVSPAFLAAADKRVFIPMVGFAESFNLSVATALVVQKLFDICPEARGDISVEQITEMRRAWYAKLLAPTRLRDKVEELVELASKGSADGGDSTLHMADLRRVTTRVGWNKKLKQRMLAADDAMGRGDVDAAVEASKKLAKPTTEAASKRARPTGAHA